MEQLSSFHLLGQNASTSAAFEAKVGSPRAVSSTGPTVGLTSAPDPVLGGSWVVISRVISPLIWVISIVILLITILITTHEPLSTFGVFGIWAFKPKLA